MERLDYVVLAPIVGAMGGGVASGVWVVNSNHAAEAVTAARARCQRPVDYVWDRALACVRSTVADAISKGA